VKKESRIIKRYSNRKLYDTSTSRYVTLNEIAAMVKSGDDVRIIENSSKEDITSVTLAQIIMEEEKNLGDSHVTVLRKIIQSGGETISGFILKNFQPQMKTWLEEAEKNIELVALKGRFTINDGRKVLRGFASSAQKSLDDLQKRIDERVESALTTLPSLKAIQGEMTSLQEKVKDLEKKLKKLKKETEDNS
jgi:polyhydroxyalkanoate synthesis repressor PhaR